MSLPSRLLRVLLLTVALAGVAEAQEAPPPPAVDTTQNAALRVYFDCDVFGCDREFMVTEMKWVNWMRDRLDADFHLLVTSQQTGGGGRKFDVVAIGQRAFAGKVDTLTVNTNPNDSEDTVRRALLRVVSQLLLPHAARGALGSQLTIAYKPSATGTAAAAPAKDKWNFWTFTLSGNGFLNGESKQSFTNLWTSVNANRTTEAWKTRLSTFYSYDESKFELDSVTTFTALQRSYEASGLIVKSLGDHWSAGGGGEVSSSQFNNIELAVEGAFAVEWDYYPYKDFTRRKFAVLYLLGARAARYREVTIYGAEKSLNPRHSLEATYGARQTWGSANVSIEAEQFLDAPKFYRAELGVEVEVKIGKGLSFNIDGRVERVRNQLSLSRGGASDQEVIARLRALQTNFRYFTFFGIRYQFGSIFNTVVNPRFGDFF